MAGKGKPKGLPKSGGRKVGTPNKDNVNAEAIAERMGCDPFEVLIAFCKGDFAFLGYESEVYHMEQPDGSVKMGYVISPMMRLSAARDAVKYLYAQKKAVELTGDENSKVEVIIKRYGQ